MTQRVLIIGAGPVGLTWRSSCALCRAGSHRRASSAPHRREINPCALGRTPRLLDRQPGGSTPFIEAGFKVDAVSFALPAGSRSAASAWVG